MPKISENSIELNLWRRMFWLPVLLHLSNLSWKLLKCTILCGKFCYTIFSFSFLMLSLGLYNALCKTFTPLILLISVLFHHHLWFFNGRINLNKKNVNVAIPKFRNFTVTVTVRVLLFWKFESKTHTFKYQYFTFPFHYLNWYATRGSYIYGRFIFNQFIIIIIHIVCVNASLRFITIKKI